MPFGRQTLVGIVVQFAESSEFSSAQLKAIKGVIDLTPLWPQSVYELLTWCSKFYLYPLGETFANAMPTALRKGKPAEFQSTLEWQLTPLGRDQLMQGFGRAVKQAQVMKILEGGRHRIR